MYCYFVCVLDHMFSQKAVSLSVLVVAVRAEATRTKSDDLTSLLFTVDIAANQNLKDSSYFVCCN